MISTPNRTDLVFPKGGWEDDETVAEAACREALEEAGVKGIISEAPLGDWIFRSKSSENSSSPQGACKGYIFALEVTDELEFWPEQANHGRRWVSMRDAYELSRYEWMREALDAFQKQLLGGKILAQSANMSEPSSLCMMLPAAAERAIALC
ncbi:Nudix hydrolase 12, mitochondrial [Ananas comosus]|uniref:Nudix hydrolase 12, mitochondrial n=1 Tax=Ananas comosus TaxID=4615 RepID=A0A199VGV2_ANACO|nr:Nudix hydrolase 12, mitochondrial [Ananas comosus]